MWLWQKSPKNPQSAIHQFIFSFVIIKLPNKKIIEIPNNTEIKLTWGGGAKRREWRGERQWKRGGGGGREKGRGGIEKGGGIEEKEWWVRGRRRRKSGGEHGRWGLRNLSRHVPQHPILSVRCNVLNKI